MSEATVVFQGTKKGKDGSEEDVTLKRPVSTTKTSTITNNSTPAPETESQYKSSCTSLSYLKLEKDLIKYTGQRVRSTGDIVQIMADSNDTQIRLDVNNVLGDTIFIDYPGSTPAVEGDTITVYGEVYGTTTYTSEANYQISLPGIDGQYIDVGTK